MVLSSKDFWLEELYYQLIDKLDVNIKNGSIEKFITEEFYYLIKNYQLDNIEYQILQSVFLTYVKVTREYSHSEVWFEPDSLRRVEKVKIK